jgi:hypothetical protein
LGRIRRWALRGSGDGYVDGEEVVFLSVDGDMLFGIYFFWGGLHCPFYVMLLLSIC